MIASILVSNNGPMTFIGVVALVASAFWTIFMVVFPFMVLSRFKALDRAVLDANLQLQRLNLELAERLYEMEKRLKQLTSPESKVHSCSAPDVPQL